VGISHTRRVGLYNFATFILSLSWNQETFSDGSNSSTQRYRSLLRFLGNIQVPSHNEGARWKDRRGPFLRFGKYGRDFSVRAKLTRDKIVQWRLDPVPVYGSVPEPTGEKNYDRWYTTLFVSRTTRPTILLAHPAVKSRRGHIPWAAGPS